MKSNGGGQPSSDGISLRLSEEFAGSKVFIWFCTFIRYNKCCCNLSVRHWIRETPLKLGSHRNLTFVVVIYFVIVGHFKAATPCALRLIAHVNKGTQPILPFYVASLHRLTQWGL